MSREKQLLVSGVNDIQYIDNLTTIHNRKFFDEVLKEALKDAMTKNIPFTLGLMDIDDFDQYNEMNGYDRGDQVLQQIGALLKRNLRGGDFALRYDAEEFMLVLVGIGKDDSFRVAERMRKLIEQYHFHGEQVQPQGNLTVSIGLASYPDDGESIEFLAKRADTALFQAKNRLKNRVEVFSL